MEVMEDLRPRIAQLQQLQGEDLAGAMDSLKSALLANPSASNLLLPEDIGKMVDGLRRQTGLAIITAATAKAKKTKEPKVQLTGEQLEKAWEEL